VAFKTKVKHNLNIGLQITHLQIITKTLFMGVRLHLWLSHLLSLVSL